MDDPACSCTTPVPAHGHLRGRQRRKLRPRALRLAAAGAAVAAALAACGGSDDDDDATTALREQGRQIFRHDTFGDERLWTDTLRLHEVVAAAVDPTTALAVGLKVDAQALPQSVVDGISSGSISLTDPATTLALLKLGAVVGLEGQVETVGGVDKLTRLGITCALCHSTVDDSFAPGIGKRLDGWPNRDLNPGAIIALSPAIDAATKATLNAWGKGKFDPRHNVDGISNPVVIPPAYGLRGIHRITFTGDGDEIAYWNRYVGVVEMGGEGTFSDARLPLSVTNGTRDLIGSKLAALQAYQLSLPAPPAPSASFDPVAAARGKAVFDGAGQCATCHSGALFTDANSRLHPPGDSAAADQAYALRSATKQWRTSPLAGVWQHPPYFHDGSAATLQAVVQAYDRKRSLGLSTQQMADLVQYLKSL